MDVEYLEEYEDILRTCQMYDGMDYDEADLLRDFENHQRNYNEFIDTNNSFLSYDESLTTDTGELLVNKKKSTIENEVKVPEFVSVNDDSEIIETDNGSKIISIRLPENHSTESESLKRSRQQDIEEKSKSSQILEKILGKCESKTKKKKLNDNNNQNQNLNNLSSCDSQYEKENKNFDDLQNTVNENNKKISPEFINTLDFVDCGASYKIINDIESPDKQNEKEEAESEKSVTNKKFPTNEIITKNIPERSLNNEMTSIKHSVMKTRTTSESNKFSISKQFSINETDTIHNSNETLITEKSSETNFTKLSELSNHVDIQKTESEISVAPTKPLDNDNSQKNYKKNNVNKLTKSNNITDNSTLLVPLNKNRRGRKPKRKITHFIRTVNSPGLKMFNNKIATTKRKRIKNSPINKSNKVISDSDNKNHANLLKTKSTKDKKLNASKIKVENNNTFDKCRKSGTFDIQVKNENISQDNEKQKPKIRKLKVMLKRLTDEEISKLTKCINVTTNTEVEKSTKGNKIINRKRKIDEISNVQEAKKQTKENNNVSKLNASKLDIPKAPQRKRQINNNQQQTSEKLPNKSQNTIKTTLVQPVTTTTTTTAVTAAITEQLISCSCTLDSNVFKTATIQGNKSILSQRRRQSKKQKDPKIQQPNTLVKQPQQQQQNQISQLHSTSSTNKVNPKLTLYEIPSFLFVETNFITRNAYENMIRKKNLNENKLLQNQKIITKPLTTATPTNIAKSSSTTTPIIATITKPSSTTTTTPITAKITKSPIKKTTILPIPEKQTIKRTIIEKRNIEIILDDIDEILEKEISKQVKNKLEKISEGFTINNENVKQKTEDIKCKKELILKNSEFNIEYLNNILKFLKIYFRSNSTKNQAPITTATPTTTTATTAAALKNTNNQNQYYHENNINLNQIHNEEFRFRKIILPSSITSPISGTSSKIVSVNLNSNEEVILPDNLINHQKIINNNNNTQQNPIILPNSNLQKINNPTKFITSTPISKYQSKTRQISSKITKTSTSSVQQNKPTATITTTTSTTINKQSPPILAVAPILSSSSSSVAKTNNTEIPLGHIDHENEMLISDNDRTRNSTNNIASLSTIQNDTSLESSSLPSTSSTLTTKNKTENSLDNKHESTSISSSSSSSSSSPSSTMKYSFRCQKCDYVQRSRPLIQDHVQKVHFKNSNDCFICHAPLKSNYLQHFMLNHSNAAKYIKT